MINVNRSDAQSARQKPENFVCHLASAVRHKPSKYGEYNGNFGDVPRSRYISNITQPVA